MQATTQFIWIKALSSAEAEYVAATLATQEAVWLRALLSDLGFPPQSATRLNEDNKSCIEMAKNPKFHARTKHIDIRYHFVRESIENKDIELVYCKSEDMLADIFTKPLPGPKFAADRACLGLK